MMGILATYSGKILARPDEDHLARVSVSYADALLTELARTCKESSQVEPDAAGNESLPPEPVEWDRWDEETVRTLVFWGYDGFTAIRKAHNAEMRRVTGAEGKS
jgi:hypothetical protein